MLGGGRIRICAIADRCPSEEVPAVRDWDLLGQQLTDHLALDADYQSTTRS